MKWPLRNLLNPVVTRSMIFGSNPFDVEYVLQKIDQIKTMSGREIKRVWFTEWELKAQNYLKNAERCAAENKMLSAERYYMLTAQCYYASYMINTDDIEQKRTVYKKLEEYYRKAVSYRKNKVEYVEIPFPEYNAVIPGYIHYPDNGEGKSYPVTVTYSGIGSSKEELDMLALPLVERGVAVLTVDLPGTGSSAFDYGVRADGLTIDAAINAIFDFLDKHEKTDGNRIANFGLCMGGGYAFRASSVKPVSKCCVSMFPLFISSCQLDSVPIWMKHGKWASFQQGDLFFDNMDIVAGGNVACDFLMLYSNDDNWMDEAATMDIYNRATGYKEIMEITEKPAYVSEETIMHAMPVGEQFHWVKYIAADFIAERI
ncbi:MAG: alpha/beta hydrolase [Oscillospiraceae bacterium]|nr:alpha/beta hydrolase [Oscillospiraceae bacterium]